MARNRRRKPPCLSQKEDEPILQQQWIDTRIHVLANAIQEAIHGNQHMECLKDIYKIRVWCEELKVLLIKCRDYIDGDDEEDDDEEEDC